MHAGRLPCAASCCVGVLARSLGRVGYDGHAVNRVPRQRAGRRPAPAHACRVSGLGQVSGLSLDRRRAVSVCSFGACMQDACHVPHRAWSACCRHVMSVCLIAACMMCAVCCVGVLCRRPVLAHGCCVHRVVLCRHAVPVCCVHA